MKISDLSHEEKLQFEKEVNLPKKATEIFWRLPILILFWFLILDRILSIGTGMNAVPPSLFNILQAFGIFACALGVAFLWVIGESMNKKWLGALLIAILVGGPFTFFMIIEQVPVLFIIIGLSFLALSFFFGIKVKWPKILWVTGAYLGVFLVVHYAFFNPLFPSTNLFGEGWWVTEPMNFPTLIKPIIGVFGGIISLIIMAHLSSKRTRRKYAFQTILKQRKKAKRK